MDPYVDFRRELVRVLGVWRGDADLLLLQVCAD